MVSWNGLRVLGPLGQLEQGCEGDLVFSELDLALNQTFLTKG